MNNYNLVTNNFILEIELKKIDEDINIPVNSNLNIKIKSDNFTAITSIDIDIKKFNEFAKKLFSIYNTLKGTAVLKEPYGNTFIMFEALPNGHICVSGVINSINKDGYKQELKFENEFDQTFLKEFVNQIINN